MSLCSLRSQSIRISSQSTRTSYLLCFASTEKKAQVRKRKERVYIPPPHEAAKKCSHGVPNTSTIFVESSNAFARVKCCVCRKSRAVLYRTIPQFLNSKSGHRINHILYSTRGMNMQVFDSSLTVTLHTRDDYSQTTHKQ